jgi:peptidyl-prolyl cis-trans isomerase SDCCAG10
MSATIHTTLGNIKVELACGLAPRLCENWLQLAASGVYDGTKFHRNIAGFLVQGGDPTGTGSGGESIYGFPFKDEFHQRLRFSRRGIVAMANAGKDSNGSQFFITFGDCEHLYKKHTIFGKITSDTIYNLMALQDLPTDSEERPLDPPVIRGTKIILNPFEDMKSNIRKQEPIKKIDQKAAI